MPTGSLPTSPTSSIPSSRAALSGEIPNEGSGKAQAATLLLVAESSLFVRPPCREFIITWCRQRDRIHATYSCLLSLCPVGGTIARGEYSV